MPDFSFLVCPSGQSGKVSWATLDPEAGITRGSEGAGTVERRVARPSLGHLLRKPFYLPASVSPLQSSANTLEQR